MGRKIPAKKHRGVKDPLQQQAKRLQSLKGKINAPPKDPDEQPVPRSLMRLFGLQDAKTNDNKPANKKKHKRPALNDSRQSNTQGKNPISQMKKLPGESGRSFSLRINSAVKALHGSIDQDDYPVEMETEPDDIQGDRMEAQRRRRERKRARAGAAGDGEPPAPTRAQRLALKKQAKKQRETEALQEKREVVYERVGFGEVAHAPPALSFKHRKAPKDAGAPRPGRRDLLLSKLLDKSSSSSGAPARHKRALPAAERMRLERARQDAVDAYRKIKAQQTKNRTQ
ncbi:hypothetical protein ABMA28_015299 [Loxostege sticticalis]|uniref:Coiled-coil domain-containing protein 137 n=1 Tax=Loxostege sticticalis TaxID=481309 RepID=A0ABD0TF05_LOXSC